MSRFMVLNTNKNPPEEFLEDTLEKAKERVDSIFHSMTGVTKKEHIESFVDETVPFEYLEGWFYDLLHSKYGILVGTRNREDKYDFSRCALLWEK